MIQTRYVEPVFSRVTLDEDIPFRTARNERGEEETLLLDVYRPAGDAETLRPAILWLHGGGFRPGNDRHQGYIVRLAEAFARRGYVSVASDYRVREQPFTDLAGTIRDAVEDGQAALAWMRLHAGEYGADAGRIAVAGGSAGGMLATNLCALEGAGSVFAFVDLWGSPAPQALLYPVTGRFPPTVIVHGTADALVPYDNSVSLARTLEAKGIRCLLHTIEGAPHTPVAHLEEFAKVLAGFLYAALPGHEA